MKRREFIQSVGLAILSGKIIYDVIGNVKNSIHEDRIYNELPKHIYDVKASGKINEMYKEQIGKGIVVKDRFLTCAHITDIGTQTLRSPFGTYEMKFPVSDLKIEVNGIELEELICDSKYDIAVYTTRQPLPRRPLPEDEKFYMNEPEFPCKPSSDRKLGDEVYIIGNPQLKGLNIRKGRISDLDGFGDIPIMKKCFGIDIQGIPGDSGTPVVSKDFKLLGLLNTGVTGGIGYVLKIEEFFK